MKVAVVGSGVSGLGATWLLNEYSEHEVHLFESDHRPGGHANTVTYSPPGREPTDVDTSIVFNPSTYPNFINFLHIFPDLAERILPTEMTFSVSRNRGEFEWAGNNLMTVFCQPSRLLDPEMWRLIYDVLRFNACTQNLLRDIKDEGDVLGEELSIDMYLKQNGYTLGAVIACTHMSYQPMTAAVWSTPPDKCALDFPARTYFVQIQFMYNHHLLQITGKPKWLTLRGGSRTYVRKIISRLPPSQLHLSTPIKALRTTQTSEKSHQVELTTASGETQSFDHVILACHTDTTVDILNAGDGMTEEEAKILQCFRWNRNEAMLHCDQRLMPRSRLAWSCWNYLTESVTDMAGKYLPNVNRVSLTYWMNELQHLPTKDHGDVLVTLNPPFEPDPALTFGRYKYDHPILSDEAIRAQSALPTIQNTRGVSYAGAWTKYGFHEDGFSSGLRAAASLFPATTPSSAFAHRETVAAPGLPFAIRPADRMPPRYVVLVAGAFEFVHENALAGMLGTLFFAVLACVRVVLGQLPGVDLSHLERRGGGAAELGTKGKRD
ncbi:FAD/NAD(P)-binding domain-containing protein [Epithele typhae]|uniref:FAD/NAD(P)-binding domain-containing protein n=1 Tax=Epithele typhae TaxID=378194 RepID=UPI0020083A0D|nr:FAD/NAD(P)-binding domain-containing protein [Epithele typhae]KAH9924661.1 FAD/NAD(P)-binding domain-containing protein [Epithele typhae]